MDRHLCKDNRGEYSQGAGHERPDGQYDTGQHLWKDILYVKIIEVNTVREPATSAPTGNTTRDSICGKTYFMFRQ